MRILMVAQFYSPVVGGEERVVEDLSVGLTRRGHEVAVATLGHDDLPAFEVDQGVRIHRIRSTTQRVGGLFVDPSRPHAPPLRDPGAVAGLKRVIQSEQPHVIHAHNWLVHSVVPLMKRLPMPLVLSLHDHSLVCANKRLMRGDEPCTGPSLGKCISCASRQYGPGKGVATALSLRLSAKALRSAVDMFVPVSQAVARGSGLVGSGLPYEVVPNMVRERFTRANGAADVDELPDRGFVLFVGDATADKGANVLVEAYAGLEGAPPLVLIGRRYPDTLKHATPNVIALGSLPHAAVAEAWRRCSVAVVPSVCPEGFGLVALEAMAMGRPVVAANSGGLAEVVVDGETGLMIPPGDAPALRAALARLLSDRTLRARLGAAGRKRAAEFREDLIVPRMEDVYRKVMPYDLIAGLREGGPDGVAAREGSTALDGSAAEMERSAAIAAAAAAAAVKAAEKLEVPEFVAPEPPEPEIEPAAPASTRHGWGAVPAVALVAAIGLALVALADAQSRTGGAGGRPLFWVGLAAIVIPFAWRLSSAAASRGERVVSVVLLGLLLYGVKVLHDPFVFTFGDEWVHAHNANEILRTGHLFGDNSILPVTPLYPGLESLTAALASLTGLSSFGAGLIVIGVARTLLMLGLFLFFETVTGSSRVAGLATLLYAAAPNYLFFGAQFSYESLALPMLVVLLFGAVRYQGETAAAGAVAWIAFSGLLIAAIVVTHHMTSYAMIGFLALASIVYAVVRGSRFRSGPWPLALIAAAATSLWLIFVGSKTVGYLEPVFTGAISDTFHTVSGEAAPRQLFQSPSGEAPLLEDRFLAIASVLVLLAVLPFGLRAVWRGYRRNPLVLFLSALAIAYVGTLSLRVVPNAWETASRASEFLFIGVALVLALAGAERLRRGRSAWPGRALVCACAAVLVCGGFSVGWPSNTRLAQTYRIKSDGTSIDPPGVGAGRWAGRSLPSGSRIGAESSDARLFQLYGHQFALAGSFPDIQDLLHSPALEDWEPGLIRDQRIRYLAVNRRLLSSDALAGYFFARPGQPSAELRQRSAVEKFDRDARTDRLFDNGEIVVYDVRRVGQ